MNQFIVNRDVEYKKYKTFGLLLILCSIVTNWFATEQITYICTLVTLLLFLVDMIVFCYVQLNVVYNVTLITSISSIISCWTCNVIGNDISLHVYVVIIIINRCIMFGIMLRLKEFERMNLLTTDIEIIQALETERNAIIERAENIVRENYATLERAENQV